MISSSTFIKDIVLFIRSYLRLNITDPLGRSDAFVFTSFPKKNTVYPLITIRNTGSKVSRLGMQSSSCWADVKIEIRVWARNAAEVDSLSQNVTETLRNAQFASAGTVNEQIFNFQLLNMNYLVEELGDQSIHSKIMTYNYNTILTT